MKRDVTRTGQRTGRGMVDDAVSFAQRYVANNYQDKSFQKAINILIGIDEFDDKTIDEVKLNIDVEMKECTNDKLMNDKDENVNQITPNSDLFATGLSLASAIVIFLLNFT
jgi:uncharacterized protein (UPF0305 family)